MSIPEHAVSRPAVAALLPQVFSEDEDLVRDTTALQLAAGRDIQGIPWELTQYSRETYRVRWPGWLTALRTSPACRGPRCPLDLR